MGGELAERAAARLLVQLGQFARDRGWPRAELGGKVGERGGEAGQAIRRRSSVAGIAASASIRSRRAAVLGGRKPSKKKRSVGSAAVVSAVTAAQAPGRPKTAMPAAAASTTSL